MGFTLQGKTLGGVRVGQNKSANKPVISTQPTPVDTGPLGGINLMDAVRAAAMAKGTPSIALSPSTDSVGPTTMPGVPASTGIVAPAPDMSGEPTGTAVPIAPGDIGQQAAGTMVPGYAMNTPTATLSPSTPPTILGMQPEQFAAMAGMLGSALAPNEYSPTGQLVPSAFGNMGNLAGQWGLAQMLAKQKSNPRTGGK